MKYWEQEEYQNPKMENFDKKAILEISLHKHRIRMRIIQSVIIILFIALCILFFKLRESTKETIIHGEDLLGGAFAWKEVKYNNIYVVGAAICLPVIFFMTVILLSDIIYCKFDTIEVNGHFITVYRGLFKNTVYINGKKSCEMGIFSLAYVLEAELPDGVEISVTFSKRAHQVAYITFSDNHPSIFL